MQMRAWTDLRPATAAFVALAAVLGGCSSSGDGGVSRIDAGDPQRKCNFQVDGVLLKNCSRDPYLIDDCETDVFSDIDNCGDCGVSCPRPPPSKDARGNLIATAWCNQGACAIACAPDYADCDGNADNGCEVALATDPMNCGACQHACPRDAARGESACGAGVCALACDAGFGDCDRQAANGCEVNLASDAKNCGSCGYVCSSVGGTPSCDLGICVLACLPGRADCNYDSADGCETDLATSACRI